ncbi:ribonuclease H [Ochrobactrum phage vB_OspM_OC]|nr:ribonuclease H [Ochrobactrum phage vB_OspM_OC]
MKNLFIVDLNSLVVQLAFGVMKSRKDKENKVPYISTRNSAVSYVYKYLEKSGYMRGDEVLIAREGRRPWRYEYLPQYKSTRDHDSMEWKQIHAVIDGAFPILQSQYGFKPIYVSDAEADDVIGTIAIHFAGQRDITIISSDKDFRQLFDYVPNLKIMSPQKKKWIEPDDSYDLHKHIMKGDKTDGIPSILNYGGGMILQDVRQWKLNSKVVKKLFDANNEFIGEEFPDVKKGYELNRMLIDLRYIPNDIKDDILDVYERQSAESTIFEVA